MDTPMSVDDLARRWSVNGAVDKIREQQEANARNMTRQQRRRLARPWKVRQLGEGNKL